MIKKIISLIILMSAGCYLESADAPIRQRSINLAPGVPAQIVPQDIDIGDIDDTLTCFKIVRASVVTCCFPCLLLFSSAIIHNMSNKPYSYQKK